MEHIQGKNKNLLIWKAAANGLAAAFCKRGISKRMEDRLWSMKFFCR